METLTRTLIDQGLTEQVLTEKQLARLLRGTDQRRYNLVNRALHAQELWRLRRGRYLLSPVVVLPIVKNGSLPDLRVSIFSLSKPWLRSLKPFLCWN